MDKDLDISPIVEAIIDINKEQGLSLDELCKEVYDNEA